MTLHKKEDNLRSNGAAPRKSFSGSNTGSALLLARFLFIRTVWWCIKSGIHSLHPLRLGNTPSDTSVGVQIVLKGIHRTFLLSYGTLCTSFLLLRQ